jgi:hypothetical protein
VIRRFFAHLYQPCHGKDGLNAPLVLWRTVWRLIMAYFLFARFDDVSRLQHLDLTVETSPAPHLRVHLSGGKTDQDSQGFWRYVSPNNENPDLCPVCLTSLYLHRIGADHSGYLVARTQLAAGRRLVLDGRYHLPYSRARQDFRTLLTTLGLDPNKYSEHSARRGAVTSASNAGLSNETLQDLVGWKSSAMPQLYTDCSLLHYLSCSAKLAL